MPSYTNITLVSLDGDLSVVIYLPYFYSNNNHTDDGDEFAPHYHHHHFDHHHHGSNDENTDQKNDYYYYYGTRFDHGSMIGSITTKRRRRIPKKKKKKRSHHDEEEEEEEEEDFVVEEEIHELMNSHLWRIPHNPQWPESGIGIASEFGVGDDGIQCDFQCGYPKNENGIINGILGYNNHNHNNHNNHGDTTTTTTSTTTNRNDDHTQEFLKIGVGVLLQGTCPTCDDSTNDDYQFNSPYLYAQIPIWTIQQQQRIIDDIPVRTIRLIHEAKTSNQLFGYQIQKEIYIHPNNASLIVTTQLYNIGQPPPPVQPVVDDVDVVVVVEDNNNNDANNNNNHHHENAAAAAASSNTFSTVWYSHNFFTCDHQPVGPGYSVDLDLHGDTILQQQPQQQPPGVDPSTMTTTTSLLYDEPGTWSWSHPIAEYATIQSLPDMIHIEMQHTLEPGIRIKTEFKNDFLTRGRFQIQACDTTIESTLSWPEQYNVPINTDESHRVVVEEHPTIEMYAYNLYIERGTLSPEPQLLFSNIAPGTHVEWTQTLTIRPVVSNDDDNDDVIHDDVNDNNETDMLEQSPLSQLPFPTLWLTNLLPGYKPPKKKNQNISSLNDHNVTISLSFIVTIVLSTLSVLLFITSSIRRRRQQRYQQYQQRQQYDSIP